MSRNLMYDERAMAEDIYNNGFTEGYFNFSEGILLAKYFRHELNYGDIRIRTKLKNFCEQYDRNFYYVPNIGRIRKMVNSSKRAFVNTSYPVPITDMEISKIKELSEYKDRKMLFAILVLSKINNRNFLGVRDWNSIRKTTHSRITNKKIAILMEKFYKLGLLEIVNYGHKVCFLDSSSHITVEVIPKTIYELNRVFVEVFGEDIFKCQECEKEIIRKSHNQKRCKECSTKIRRKRKTFLEREYRKNKKEI